MIFLTPHALFLSTEIERAAAGLGEQALVHPPSLLPFHSDLTRYDQERNFTPGTSPVVCTLGLAGKGEIQLPLDCIARHSADLGPLALAPDFCLASD